MKRAFRGLALLAVWAAFAGCTPDRPSPGPPSADLIATDPPLYTLNERQTDQFLEALGERQADLCERIVTIARRNLGQPYDLYLLGEYPFETLDPDPVYCLARSDCVTFCEHTYAMALSDDFDTFLRVLQRIRYKDGIISMITRNHFTVADWDRNNAWLFDDLTGKLGNGKAAVELNQVCRRAPFFARYGVGSHIPDEIIKDTYIPTTSVPAILPELRDGDFINIIRGTPQSQWAGHTGLIDVSPGNIVEFIHSARPQVRVEPLVHYIENDARCVGIKILRLRPEAERLARQAIVEPQVTAVSLTKIRFADNLPARHAFMCHDDLGRFDIASGEASAVYESEVVEAEFPFNEAILSWNLDVPWHAAACVEFRAGRSDGDTWTPYLHMGEWAPDESLRRGVAFSRQTECAQGKVDVDIFRADRSFNRLQYRVCAYRAADLAQNESATAGQLHIARVAICLSDTRGLAPRARRQPEASAGKAGSPESPLVRLEVPYRSQQAEAPDMAGRICCPTSLAMVMQYRGCDRPTAEVARRTYDPVHDIYGNWTRAIQTAYTYGMPGYITRFENWAQVEQSLAQGQPLIITITVQPGELKNAPFTETEGHLLVLTGFDKQGNPIVNDPAAPSAERGRAIYSRDQLEWVWLKRKKGTALVLQ